MEGFDFVVAQEVSLRDLDGFGHVNNAVYLTYAENARVAYFQAKLGVRSRDEIANVMARATIEFRAEIDWGAPLSIGVRAARVGTKSFDLEYRIQLADGRVAADVTTAQVTYDFDQRRSVPVPDAWRRALEADVAATRGEQR